MFRYNIVVRWANGDLEGFTAYGLDRENALKRALKKASDKASMMENGNHIVLTETDFKALSKDDQTEIKMHWSISSKE